MFIDLIVKRVSQIMMDADETAYIGQLPRIHLGHLKDSNPGADHQESEDDSYNDPR